MLLLPGKFSSTGGERGRSPHNKHGRGSSDNLKKKDAEAYFTASRNASKSVSPKGGSAKIQERDRGSKSLSPTGGLQRRSSSNDLANDRAGSTDPRLSMSMSSNKFDGTFGTGSQVAKQLSRKKSKKCSISCPGVIAVKSVELVLPWC